MTKNNEYYWAREKAALALVAVEGGMWAKDALEKFTGEDKTTDALLTEIVYGTLQNLLFLDHVLSFYLKHPLEKLTPHVRNILRSALYQLHFLDQYPKVRLSMMQLGWQGASATKAWGLVNGVLRSFLRKKVAAADACVDRLSVQYSHPKWLVERWVEELGAEETERLLKWNNNRHPLCARVNSLVIDADEYVQLLDEQGIKYFRDHDIPAAVYLPKSGRVGDLPLFAEGAVQPQSKASMLVALILGAQPHEVVLDLCAAPGTKTGHIAELMKNTGKITAVDISEERLVLARENLARLKVKNVQFVQSDATQLELPQFDRVLVDAPCSGLGTLAHRPDARYQKTEESLRSLPELQLQIINRAAKLLKPGGVLVYSTCTTEKAENWQVVENFLQLNPDFVEEEEIPRLQVL